MAIFNPLDDGELPSEFWIKKNPQWWRNPSIFAAQLRNPGLLGVCLGLVSGPRSGCLLSVSTTHDALN
jgi:hypothetical protein